MSFISNSKDFTIAAGVCNNVHGSINSYTFNIPRHAPEEEDGIELVPVRTLQLLKEIGSGPGYLWHLGNARGVAVIVKVFNRGPTAQEQLEATLHISRKLMHPNVLRVQGVSLPGSSCQFLTYEPMHQCSAEGRLAIALTDDSSESSSLGFKMVAGLAAGCNYLNLQGLPMEKMGVENFDIFLKGNDQFTVSINPRRSDRTRESPSSQTAWSIFNALCEKVLRAANSVVNGEPVHRPSIPFDIISSITPVDSETGLAGEPSTSENAESFDCTVPPKLSLRLRREYVWRTELEEQSLSDIATGMALELEFKLTPLTRLRWADPRQAHRCAGYLREEVTLAVSKARSAIISHDVPGPFEICPICKTSVDSDEEFSCPCGAVVPGKQFTVKCLVCKKWSHSDCVGNPVNFKCLPCTLGTTSPSNRTELNAILESTTTSTGSPAPSVQPIVEDTNVMWHRQQKSDPVSSGRDTEASSHLFLAV
ncbi:hypothetical protein C8R46DRAFT_1218831 [Mycena filopes]|nr:hypothetical protein C8R46DRAFT_1218831 [Mycena filopes]